MDVQWIMDRLMKERMDGWISRTMDESEEIKWQQKDRNETKKETQKQNNNNHNR